MVGRSIMASVVSLVAIGSFGVSAASAQDIGPVVDPGLMGVAAANAQALQGSTRHIGSRFAAARAAPRRVAGPSTAQIVARTSFRPDAAAKNRVYTRAIGIMQRTSPPDAVKLRAELSSGRMHKAVADYLGRYGMSADNLVDTTAVYLAAAWFASRANTGDPTPAQMRGLRSQVASIYATMPQVLSASPALKQELSEANVFQAWVSSSLANQAAADPASSSRLRAAAVQGVRTTYQLDLSRMSLTNSGLR